MNKKFRCGRLILTKDGIVKKLDLDRGGGTRCCTWDYTSMNFDDVHERLVTLFNIGKIFIKIISKVLKHSVSFIF